MKSDGLDGWWWVPGHDDRAQFGRLHADTLDKLCTFFDVDPGALLEWTPKKGRRGTNGKTAGGGG